MAIDKLTEQMLSGDIQAILEGFVSNSYVDNVNAVVQSVLHDLKEKAVEVQLTRLKSDNTCIFGHNAGYRVSHFALAGLHLLGFSEYSGSDRYVLDLINSKFNF